MLVALSAFMAAGAAEKDTESARVACLEQLQRMMPHSEHWEKWLAESGELPPDFDSMPSTPLIPDPLAGA
ncbi:MAG: hypothetical protein GY851_02795, partial [bacterium]|nr:hypothetical protein [bacterium]